MKAEIFKEMSIEDIMLLYVKGVNDRDYLMYMTLK